MTIDPTAIEAARVVLENADANSYSATVARALLAAEAALAAEVAAADKASSDLVDMEAQAVECERRNATFAMDLAACQDKLAALRQAVREALEEMAPTWDTAPEDSAGMKEARRILREKTAPHMGAPS